MSIHIKKSVIFDPKNILIQNPHESDQSEEQPYPKSAKIQNTNRKLAQMPKLIVTELEYQASNQQSTPPKSEIKTSPLPKKASRQIQISWAQEGANFTRQIQLGQQISQLLQQKQIIQNKLSQCESSITKLESLLFSEKSKNRQLKQKIEAIAHQNVTAQQFYEMEQAFIKIESQFSQLQIENTELSYQVDDLQQKETLYERLLVDHNCLKTRRDQSEANNEKYRAEIVRMKKSLRDFESDFYSTSKRAGSKKEEKEMTISLTEKKLEMMTFKLHEFEDMFNKTQLQAFEKIKDDMIEQYEQYEGQEIDKLEAKSEAQKEQAEKQIKLKAHKELTRQLREVEKKIEEYKNRMREVKLTREKKSVREKVDDLTANMAQLSHSQIITSLSMSLKKSVATVEMKNKYGQKAKQSPENPRLITLETSETLNQSQIQKTTVPINQVNVLSSPQIHVNTQRLSSISPSSVNTRLSSISPTSNYANLSSINPALNTNSKLSMINEPVINSKLQNINSPINTGNLSSINPLYSNARLFGINTPPPAVVNQQTGRHEYENGVQIPTQDELQFLQHECKSLKTQVASYEEQIKAIRNEYQKMSTNNEKLYKQAQLWKVKAQKLTKELEKIKVIHSSALLQLQNNNASNNKYQQIELQTFRKQNHRLDYILEAFDVENKKLKKTKLQLQHEIESLKKQSALLQTAYQTKISQINAQIAQKNTGQFGIQMRQQIQRKDFILQRQLEENLSLTNQIGSTLQKIKQLQTLNSQISSTLSQKTQRHQTLTKNLRDSIFKVESLTQQLRQKDLRVKRAEENLSVQMAQKRAQILTHKKQNKKLENKIQSIKERYEQQIQKRKKKYQRLEQKMIGIENANQSLKQSLGLSRSLQLKRSIMSKGDDCENNGSILLRKQELFMESGSFQLSII